MNIICQWEFIDKDANKKWLVLGACLFICALMVYVLLVVFSKQSYKYTPWVIWTGVFSCLIFFLSTTPRFSWKTFDIYFIKSDDNTLSVCIHNNVLEREVLLDCKYVFSDYRVFINKELGKCVVNIKGPCVLQYLHDGEVVNIEQFENKWIGFGLDDSQRYKLIDYFDLD